MIAQGSESAKRPHERRDARKPKIPVSSEKIYTSRKEHEAKMTEAAYQAIYERAQANLEKSGAENPYDILGPDLPGTETALAGYERFGLRDAPDAHGFRRNTGFDFMGKKLRCPVMTGSMSANTLAAHWPDGFLQVAEGAARYGTQYWIGDCDDDTWREAAASYPSAIRVVKPWRDKQRTLTSLKLAEDTGAFRRGDGFRIRLL